MDLQLTEDQKMFQKMVRDFAKKEIEPAAERIDVNEEYPFENLKKMAALGITGLTIDEKYGGSGSTMIHWVIAMEEIARACASTATVLDTTLGLAGHCIYHHGNEEQIKRWVTPLVKAEKIGCFGLTEPNHGSDVSGMDTTATKDGDSWIINGNKIFISNADVADIFVIFATKDKSLGYKGMCTFVVEKGTPGLSIGEVYHRLGIRGAHNAEIVLDNCRIPAENMLGEEGKGIRHALASLDGARIGIAALAIGIGRACLEEAVAHMKQRVQYAQPIADFQGLNWRIADLATKIDAARLLAYRAADLKDKGLPFTTEAAMAKGYASDEVAMPAATTGIQMLGGYGYMMDSPMQRHFRDAKITQIYEGTAEIMKVVIARAVFR